MLNGEAMPQKVNYSVVGQTNAYDCFNSSLNPDIMKRFWQV